MPLNIGLWRRTGFSNYGSRPQMGSRTVIFGLRNQLVWQIRSDVTIFVIFTWKLKVGLKWIYFYYIYILGAISYFILSVVCCDACLNYQMIIKTRHNSYASLLWPYKYCWMISTGLNHCKEMGAEPGRRFLKQPAEKLEPVIVAVMRYYTMIVLTLTYWPILTLLHSFRHEDMLLFRL